MSCNCCSDTSSASGRVDFQYATKIVCGVKKPSSPDTKPNNPLPPGQYFTKINIHNPSRCDCVTFRWKVAVGLPLEVGPISDFTDATLCPDEALEIDCAAIFKRLGANTPAHIEGWLVIESPAQLDVVAVYGTSQTAGGDVNTFHTERVQPRCLPVCEDFHLDISTGNATWQVQIPGSTAFALATLTQPVGPWAGPPVGSLWVRPAGSIYQPIGDYTYQLEFKLCSGFRHPNLNLQLLADYYAKVYLNGSLIGTTTPPPVAAGFTNISSVTTNSHFKAGTNILKVVVTNTEDKSPTGLALQGSIEVGNGRCPGEPMPVFDCGRVCYQIYAADFKFNPFIGMFMYNHQGYEDPVCNGAVAGTTGGFRRIEQFQLWLSGFIPPGTAIEYRVFTRNLGSPLIGWSAWTTSGPCGSTGPDHPITAVEARLINAPVHWHLAYSVCRAPNLGFPVTSPQWSPVSYDGAIAGSDSGTPYQRVEAVKCEIVCW